MKQLAQINNINSPSTRFTSSTNLGGEIISAVLPYLIIGAGLFFFLRLITAGYTYLTGLGDAQKVEMTNKQLTFAFLGLLIVLVSYFLALLIEIILGINIV